MELSSELAVLIVRLIKVLASMHRLFYIFEFISKCITGGPWTVLAMQSGEIHAVENFHLQLHIARLPLRA